MSVPEEWSPTKARLSMESSAASARDGLVAVYERALSAAWLNGVNAGVAIRGDRDAQAWIRVQEVRLGFAPKETLTIQDRLRAAGRDWFALRPVEGGKWLLNPCEQDKYAFGCFTLADLEAWVDDKGPIVIKKAPGGKRASKRGKDRT